MSNKIALVKNNIIENIIISDLDFAQTLGYDSIIDLDAKENVDLRFQIGEAVPSKPSTTATTTTKKKSS